MSKQAAAAFHISQDDLLKFLDLKSEPEEIAPAIKISDHAKHVILVVSIFLFIVAIVTCGCTLCLWMFSKRKRGYEPLDKSEKADLACDEDAINGSVNGSPALPQMSEKPKVSSNFTTMEKDIFDEEEIRKLRVTDVDLSSSYYVNRKRLQVNVRRVVLSEVNEQLTQNAYVYMVVSLLPEKSAFYESELRPVAEENYFEEASEFDIVQSELPSRQLKIAIYACDRFSQHRLVKEFGYELSTEEGGDVEQPASVIPVKMNETYRSPDNDAVASSEAVRGEVLFSLCYMPTSGRLTFVALKGRNIHDAKETPLATYLRVSLLVAGKTMKTVQTSSVRRSTAPVYNEAFVFHTPLERIKDTDIIVSVMTYGQSESQPKMLGKIIVGPESDNNLGRKHWEAMLTSPRKPVAQWHSLSEAS